MRTTALSSRLVGISSAVPADVHGWHANRVAREAGDVIRQIVGDERGTDA
jgi:hypothetical protein